MGANSFANKKSVRRKNLTPIEIQSTYLSRTDYNDLQPADYFQTHLANKFDEYFNTFESVVSLSENIPKIEAKHLKYNIKYSSVKVFVNAEIAFCHDFVCK